MWWKTCRKSLFTCEDPQGDVFLFVWLMQWRLQEFFFHGVLGWACSFTIFFFFFFSDSLLQFFFFLDFSSIFFFIFFILLESNVMNTVLDPVSICLVEQNISVLIYFDVSFQGVSEFLKKIKNNIYLYFLIHHKIIDSNK